MRLSVNNTNSYLKKSLSTKEIVAALERTEVEVEEILSSRELDTRIISAKVKKVWAHPNADRLKIAEVSYGDQSAIVVCGAPNLVTDLVVAYAQPKTILPDGTKIDRATIRGEKSAGMLCSAKELGISDDHDGILELDPDLPLGISLCDIENTGDVVDIKTPANRWDMMSVLGLAREISANSLKNEIIEPKRSELSYFDKKVVNVKEIGECTRFISARLSVQHNRQSPKWLVDNLVAAGMRPINAVVDITNFVMLETGQPSHAYDNAKISGSLQVRFAKNNESLTTLDGSVLKLTKADLVIADRDGCIALAGVMGGASTEVSDDTSEILLEVANFNKTTVRRAALRHGLRTEASGRFEKGLPLPLQDFAFSRIIYLLQTICGAKILDGPNDQLYAWPWVRHIGLRVRKAERFLGTSLDEKQLLDGLHARGFEAEHFSITKEARKHLGKPYVWGASYKLNGDAAFDCGYFVDYIYSLIGKMVGHQCLELFESGEEIDESELKPGDTVFRDGPWEKLESKDRKGLSHVALYIGNGKIIHARDTVRNAQGKWEKLPKDQQMVVEESVEVITKDPDYKGARRYIDSFNHTIAVTCPWWRIDVETEQDLYEEAAKILGYENLPTTLPQLPPMQTEPHQFVLHMENLRDSLVARGLFEVMTYSFVSKKHLDSSALRSDSHLRIINPLSIEQEFLRSSILMSHVQVVSNNREFWQKQFGFFEFSRVYMKDTRNKDKKSESWRLAITMVGEDSISRLKNVLDVISEKYDWATRISKIENDNYITGRMANIEVDGDTLGIFGQIQPSLLREYKITHEVSFCELTITEELLKDPIILSRPIPTYQYIQRDYTLELSEETYWQTLVDALPSTDSLVRIMFVTEFADEELVKNKLKRLSFRIWLDCGAQPSQAAISQETQKILTCLKQSKSLGKFRVC